MESSDIFSNIYFPRLEYQVFSYEMKDITPIGSTFSNFVLISLLFVLEPRDKNNFRKK